MPVPEPVPLAQVLALGRGLGQGRGPAQGPLERPGLRGLVARVRQAVGVPAFSFTSPLFFCDLITIYSSSPIDV